MCIHCWFFVYKGNKKLLLFFKLEEGWEWYVCEGFQLILKKQAEALEALGVCPQMKVCKDQPKFSTV